MLSIGNQEQRLIKRLQDGDDSAAHEFYALYADYLAAICSRYIPDENDMKDVFQDAFIHIFTHIGEFHNQGPGSLKAWSAKVVVNESLKFLRTKKRHEMVELDFDKMDEAETDDPPISHIPPDIIYEMLSQLPNGYRTVLNLYVFEGMSHKEIAQLLGIKESSSASQLHRAKNQLAKLIREYNNQSILRQ